MYDDFIVHFFSKLKLGHLKEIEPTNLEKFKYPGYCLRVEVRDPVQNLNSWPPIWLVSSVGSALHQYCRGHESKSHTGLNFFRPYLHYCLSNVHYCDDCFYIHFFVCSSHIIFHMFTVNSNTSMEWYICLSHNVVTSDVGCEVFIAYCWSSSFDGVSWVHVTFILLCSAVIGWNSRAVIGTSFRSVFLCGLHPTNNLT